MAIWDIRERYDLVRANDVKGTRGLFSGGYTSPANDKSIDMLTLETQGSAVDFGDISITTNQLGGGNSGSSTRAFVRLGGENANSYYEAGSETIDIKGGTGATSQTFGDLTVGASGHAACSSHVRAVGAGGQVAPNGNPQNVIDYFTIATFGNATDFGDLTVARGAHDALASPTRGIFAGGFVGPGTMKNEIDFITIASTGNASDFGDLDVVKRYLGSGSNQTKGITVGGQSQSGGSYPNVATMAHITIATTGNAVDFGDLTAAKQAQAVSNQVHMFAGGGSNTNSIDKISFTNLANSIDFGDLTRTYNVHMAASDGHGGLNDSNYIGIQRPSVTYMTGSGRAVIHVNNGDYDFFNINTQGTTANFADQRVSHSSAAGCSSSTRGVTTCERTSGSLGGDGTGKNMEYVTLASGGKAADFGDMATLHLLNSACSDATRGVSQGGQSGGSTDVDVMEYFTFATAGNAADFGNLTVARARSTSFESNTRGICSNGRDFDGPSVLNTIDYITIQTTGNATDFGDSTESKDYVSGTSSNLRGLTAGGYAPGASNVIDYVTIASTGDATDFGDLSRTRTVMAATSNNLRGYFGGGYVSGNLASADFVTIASTGNAADFGDLRQAGEYYYAVSDSHGGLTT